jgi:hypothetical protein
VNATHSDPEWASWEVSTFIKNTKDPMVIAISVGDELNDADLKGSPFEFLHDQLFIREELANVAPSRPSASSSINERGRRRRQFWLYLILLLFAFAAGVVAEGAGDETGRSIRGFNSDAALGNESLRAFHRAIPGSCRAD